MMKNNINNKTTKLLIYQNKKKVSHILNSIMCTLILWIFFGLTHLDILSSALYYFLKLILYAQMFASKFNTQLQITNCSIYIKKKL